MKKALLVLLLTFFSASAFAAAQGTGAGKRDARETMSSQQDQTAAKDDDPDAADTADEKTNGIDEDGFSGLLTGVAVLVAVAAAGAIAYLVLHRYRRRRIGAGDVSMRNRWTAPRA